MGKSSSQVVGYRHYAKFAAFIGNRIEKLIGINFDNRGWIIKDKDDDSSSLTIAKPFLYGENEGGVAGIVDIHPGLPDAEPDVEYQKHFPLVSGYPYQSYLVFRGLGANPNSGIVGNIANLLLGFRHESFYLGNSGYMKEMLLWVKRTLVRNDGRPQWYDQKAEIFGGDVDAYVKSLSSVRLTADYRGVFVVSDDIDLTEIKYIDMNNESVFKSERIYAYGAKGYVDSYISTRVSIETAGTAYCEITLKYAANRDFISLDLPPHSELISKTTSGGVITEIYTVAISFDLPVYVQISDLGPVGEYTYLEITSIEIKGFYPKTSYDDINPIHKIREILTDDTAMGKPETDINDLNFTKAADRIRNENLGISWAIDEKSCIDALEELCYHIEAGIRVNRQTGLYEMVLFRDDWFEEGEIHGIAENKIKDLSIEVMNSDDIVNQLNVTYYDRERIKNSTFSVYENGSILTMGHANAESVEFPYFMNMRNAEIVANWKLKQFSTPAWSGSFTTGWKEARKWNRYDLIRLPWSKKWNGTILVRIMKINLGNGTDNTVTIDFEEVIPYSGEMNTSIVVDAPVDSGPQLPQSSINAVFEAPYYLTVLRAGQTNVDLELSHNPDIGYVAAIAAKPQNNSLNALLYTDGGVGEFEQVSRLDYCDILQLDQPINETASAFVVTGSLTQTANSNNLILLNGELMGFVAFDDATKVLTVKRGVLDTVPKKHSSGSLFVFDLPDVAFDSTQYAQSEIIEAQVLTTTPSGIQELSANGQAIEIKSRAIRPYPPANVKINGEYWPAYFEDDFTLTWSDRNRLQQTGGVPLGYFESSISLEPNTQTLLTIAELDADDVELATHNVNVTALNSYTLLESVMQAGTRALRINLKTVRDGYECLNIFNHTVVISNLTAPTDVTFEVIEI